MDTTITEAQELVHAFVAERKWHSSPSDILLHMIEELGEIARNILSIKNYGGNHTSDAHQNMAEELADLFYLLLKLANVSKINLGTAFLAKLQKNSNRFPPDKI